MPPIAEQTAIAYFIDQTTAKIHAATARAHRQIELLREYRSRLIADAVTGKLDVREAAAAAPNVDPLAARETNEGADGSSEGSYCAEDATVESAG